MGDKLQFQCDQGAKISGQCLHVGLRGVFRSEEGSKLRGQSQAARLNNLEKINLVQRNMKGRRVGCTADLKWC